MGINLNSDSMVESEFKYYSPVILVKLSRVYLCRNLRESA